MVRRVYLAGFFSGMVAFATAAVLTAFGFYWRFNDTANNAAVFAAQPVAKGSAANQVQLYFPLERFLAWSSTSDLQLALIQNQVRVRLYRQPLSSVPLHLTIDILGVPSVSNGFFMLKKVKGFIDHIPIPAGILFSAIAAEGGKYGVRVNQSRDTLFIDRTFGAYRLAGYDITTKDLIITMPVSTVLKAARNETPL